jgi:hypothetical protein
LSSLAGDHAENSHKDTENGDWWRQRELAGVDGFGIHNRLAHILQLNRNGINATGVAGCAT